MYKSLLFILLSCVILVYFFLLYFSNIWCFVSVWMEHFLDVYLSFILSDSPLTDVHIPPNGQWRAVSRDIKCCLLGAVCVGWCVTCPFWLKNLIMAVTVREDAHVIIPLKDCLGWTMPSYTHKNIWKFLMESIHTIEP